MKSSENGLYSYGWRWWEPPRYIMQKAGKAEYRAFQHYPMYFGQTIVDVGSPHNVSYGEIVERIVPVGV